MVVQELRQPGLTLKILLIYYLLKLTLSAAVRSLFLITSPRVLIAHFHLLADNLLDFTPSTLLRVLLHSSLHVAYGMCIRIKKIRSSKFDRCRSRKHGRIACDGVPVLDTIWWDMRTMSLVLMDNRALWEVLASINMAKSIVGITAACLDETFNTLSDGVDEKLKKAVTNFDIDVEEMEKDDFTFSPDVEFPYVEDFTFSPDVFLGPLRCLPVDRRQCLMGFVGVGPRYPRNVRFLANFITESGITIKRNKTKLSAKAQRKIAREIKTARAFGLMPFTTMGTKHFILGRIMEALDEDYECDNYDTPNSIDMDANSDPVEEEITGSKGHSGFSCQFSSKEHRSSRSVLFDGLDGIEEGGLRASSFYSRDIDEHDNEKAMDSLQDRVVFLKKGNKMDESRGIMSRTMDQFKMIWLLRIE
ncbi:hypothetical protein LguiB_014535 [Lonicera macranthoides]